MNPNCIYEVKTHWGPFRLDMGAYEDYLKGKLWITWVPGKHAKPIAEGEAVRPVHISDEAVRLYETAEKNGVWQTAKGTSVLPFVKRLSDVDIMEMNISVRSSNGLMRAGAKTLGRVAEILSRENGLRGIRNLGAKSEAEIVRCFYELCYERLSYSEKLSFGSGRLNCTVKRTLDVREFEHRRR